jgi:protein-disulfide isomerase
MVDDNNVREVYEGRFVNVNDGRVSGRVLRVNPDGSLIIEGKPGPVQPYEIGGFADPRESYCGRDTDH